MQQFLIHAIPACFRRMLPTAPSRSESGALSSHPHPDWTMSAPFVGHFEMADARKSGNYVLLDFSLRLFNVSGEAITSGTVSVTGAFSPRTPYRLFPTVSMSDRENLLVTDTLSLRTRDYRLWLDGIAPRAYIEHFDQNGRPRREAIEMIPMKLAQKVLP